MTFSYSCLRYPNPKGRSIAQFFFFFSFMHSRIPAFSHFRLRYPSPKGSSIAQFFFFFSFPHSCIPAFPPALPQP